MKEKEKNEIQSVLSTYTTAGTPKEYTETDLKRDIAEEKMEDITPELQAMGITDEELAQMLRRKRNDKRGRPKKTDPATVREKDLYTRTSIIIRKDLLAKLWEISFVTTATIKELVNSAIELGIENYEKAHGEVVPKKHEVSGKALFAFRQKKNETK